MSKTTITRGKGLVFLVALVISFLTFTSSALADSLYLNVEGITQQESNWCWAASDKCVIDYLKQTYPTQSDIVSWMFGSPPPNDGATSTEMQQVLSHYNITSTLNNASVPFSTIVDNISGWYSPMIAGLYQPLDGVGHAVVIYGYYEDPNNQLVSYMDPGYNTGSWWQSETYGYFSSHFTEYWASTLYYNH